MKILNIDSYLDGGTIKIETTKGIYCIDGRVSTNTSGILFLNYPKGNDSNIIDDQDKLKREIVAAIDEYNPSFSFNKIDYKLKIKKLFS